MGRIWLVPMFGLSLRSELHKEPLVKGTERMTHPTVPVVDLDLGNTKLVMRASWSYYPRQYTMKKHTWMVGGFCWLNGQFQDSR